MVKKRNLPTIGADGKEAKFPTTQVNGFKMHVNLMLQQDGSDPVRDHQRGNMPTLWSVQSRLEKAALVGMHVGKETKFSYLFLMSTCTSTTKEKLSMEKSFVVLLVLFSFSIAFAKCGGGFRCYVGSSIEPDKMETLYIPPRDDFEPRCFRYEVPTCSGCVEPDPPPLTCQGGCDGTSIQNATYTWYYGVSDGGECMDILDHWGPYIWYRNAICCSTDLCNYPINSANYVQMVVSPLLVLVIALSF